MAVGDYIVKVYTMADKVLMNGFQIQLDKINLECLETLSI